MGSVFTVSLVKVPVAMTESKRAVLVRFWIHKLVAIVLRDLVPAADRFG